jgi:hypothetical protein
MAAAGYLLHASLPWPPVACCLCCCLCGTTGFFYCLSNWAWVDWGGAGRCGAGAGPRLGRGGAGQATASGPGSYPAEDTSCGARLILLRLRSRRHAFEVYLKQKDPSNDARVWNDVVRWEEATPQFFLASDIATGTLTANDKTGTIKYSVATGTYSVVTTATLGSNNAWFYMASVRAVYGNGARSAASSITTFDHELEVSGITLIKGNPRATTPEGLLLSWVGEDNTAGTPL